MFESDLERRVLGHLPPWRTPEEAKAAADHEIAEGFRTITCYDLPELTARMAVDSGLSAKPDEATVAAALTSLQGKGFATAIDGGRWQMTEAGMTALHTPEGVVPPPHDFSRIQTMITVAKAAVQSGFEAGTNEFNRMGGLDREGFQAWRAAGHGDGIDAAELDAAEAETPAIPPPPAEQEVPNA